MVAKNLFLKALRSWHTVTIGLNCTSQDFLTYLLTKSISLTGYTQISNTAGGLATVMANIGRLHGVAKK